MNDVTELLDDVLLVWYERSHNRLKEIDERNINTLETILIEMEYPLSFVSELVHNLTEGPPEKPEPAVSKKDRDDDASILKKAKEGDVAAQLKIAHDEIKKNDPRTDEILEIKESNLKSIREFIDLGFSESAGAPGCPGSMWNEIMSLMVARSILLGELEEDPLTIMRYLVQNYGDTGLGKEIRSLKFAKPLNVGDIGEGVDKADRGLYSRAFLAAKSGIRKARRLRAMLDDLKWEKCVLFPLFGDTTGLKRQQQLIGLSDKVVVPSSSGDLVDVPSAELAELIRNSGSKENPSDTAFFIYNKETGEISCQFYSDKASSHAIVANCASVKADLVGEHVQDILKSMVNEDIAFDESDHEMVWQLRSDYAGRVLGIEDQLREITTQPVKSIVSVIEDESIFDEVVEYMQNLSNGSDPAKYWKVSVQGKFIKPFESPRRSKDGKLTTPVEYALKYLPDRIDGLSYEDSPPTEKEAARAFFKKTTEESPTRDEQVMLMRLQEKFVNKNEEDLATQIEKIRKDALGIESELIDRLNAKKTLDVGGVQVGLGTYVEAQSIWHFGHFDMIDGDSIMFKYPYMFEINMSMDYLDGEVLKKCLNIDSKIDFIQRFRIGDQDQIGKTGLGDGKVTGKIRMIYALLEDGTEIPIMQKIIRSKSGILGKLEVTYKWTPEMRKRIREHGRVE